MRKPQSVMKSNDHCYGAELEILMQRSQDGEINISEVKGCMDPTFETNCYVCKNIEINHWYFGISNAIKCYTGPRTHNLLSMKKKTRKNT